MHTAPINILPSLWYQGQSEMMTLWYLSLTRRQNQDGFIPTEEARTFNL